MQRRFIALTCLRSSSRRSQTSHVAALHPGSFSPLNLHYFYAGFLVNMASYVTGKWCVRKEALAWLSSLKCFSSIKPPVMSALYTTTNLTGIVKIQHQLPNTSQIFQRKCLSGWNFPRTAQFSFLMVYWYQFDLSAVLGIGVTTEMSHVQQYLVSEAHESVLCIDILCKQVTFEFLALVRRFIGEAQ